MRRLLLRVLASRDILIFQIGNWLSAMAWYATFATHAKAAFAPVAAAEVAWGFVGVFVTATGVRLQGGHASRTTEHRILVLRGCLFAVVATVALLGGLGLPAVLAVLSFCATPAHLPMLLGYQSSLTWPLLLRLPMAALLTLVSTAWLGPLSLACLYFAPTLLYGFVAYCGYYRRITTLAPACVPPALFDRSTGVTLLLTACANRVQADMIAGIVQRSSALAVLERLLRSTYSFVYPYLVRAGVTQSRRLHWYSAALAVLLAVVLAIHLSGRTNADLFIPVLMDVYTSLLAGRAWLADLSIVLGFAALLYPP